MRTPLEEEEASDCIVCKNKAKFFCSSCGSGVDYCSLECQQLDWSKTHKFNCVSRKQISPPVESNQTPEIDGIYHEQVVQDFDDIKFYIHQIYLIIIPVYLCIFLSILWVKLSKQTDKYFGNVSSSVISAPAAVSAGSVFTGDNADSGGSLTTALIIMGQIIGSTVLLVILVCLGCMKILYVLFGIVIIGLLGLFGYILSTSLLFVFNLPLDYFSFAFFIWNMAIVGMLIIFYKGPMKLRQAYLIFMSSLMALSLTSLPDLTTWVLLGLLVVWDLVAVLCPFGPLKLLLEATRKRNVELPSALIYTAAVWFMAIPPEENKYQEKMEVGTIKKPVQFNDSSEGEDEESSPDTPSHSVKSWEQESTNETDLVIDHSFVYTDTSTHMSVPLSSSEIPTSLTVNRESICYDDSSISAISGHDVNSSRNSAPAKPADLSLVTRQPTPTRTMQVFETEEPVNSMPQPADGNNEELEEEEDDGRNNLKLGLGDFVFYSVLVARAALFDWVTTVTCTISVTTGLTLTIFLLAIYKKALPALPISISFGILFYFLSSLMLTPFSNSLVQSNNGAGEFGYLVGRNGAGFIYV